MFLRIPAYLFPVWAALLVAAAVAGNYMSGPLPLLVLLALGFSFCGLTLATIALYVARIYQNGLMRPNYIINRRESVLQE